MALLSHKYNTCDGMTYKNGTLAAWAGIRHCFWHQIGMGVYSVEVVNMVHKYAINMAPYWVFYYWAISIVYTRHHSAVGDPNMMQET